MAGNVDISFVGRTPALPHKMQFVVAEGLKQGIPVVVDTTVPSRPVLRPARQDEHSTDTRAVYMIESPDPSSMVLYEIANPTVVAGLKEQNKLDTATPEGSAYEQGVIGTFLAGGKVITDCAGTMRLPDHLSVLLQIETDGTRGLTIIQPEGSIAQCILKTSGAKTYPRPKARFTAQSTINVHD